MNLTKGQALELHWQMWTDMQTALGDNPTFKDRLSFKVKWCEDHFPGEDIESYCFLCEYAVSCDVCPIKWSDEHKRDTCSGGEVSHAFSPISEILALPVREWQYD